MVVSDDQTEVIPFRYKARIHSEKPPNNQGGVLLQVDQIRRPVVHAKEDALRDLERCQIRTSSYLRTR